MAVRPTGDLDAAVLVRDPQGNLVTLASSGGAGQTAFVQMASVADGLAGEYSIDVDGVGASVGAFDIELVLKRVARRRRPRRRHEQHGGDRSRPANGGDRLGRRRRQRCWQAASALGEAVASDTFESGALDGRWTTTTSLPEGRIA